MTFVLKKISSQKKDPSRLTLVFPDFFIGVSSLIAADYHLEKGISLSEKLLGEIWEKEIIFRTKEKALFLLSFRPRSKKELTFRLRRYLKKTGGKEEKLPPFLKIKTENTLGKVIADLEKEGLVDDRKFSLWWLEQRKTFRPRSSLEIKAELFRKGVGREIVDEALAEFSYDDSAMAKRLAEKRWSFWGSFSPGGRRKKTTAYLQRKGFSFSLIKNLIDEMEKKG